MLPFLKTEIGICQLQALGNPDCRRRTHIAPPRGFLPQLFKFQRRAKLRCRSRFLRRLFSDLARCLLYSTTGCRRALATLKTAPCLGPLSKRQRCFQSGSRRELKLFENNMFMAKLAKQDSCNDGDSGHLKKKVGES